MIDPAPTKILIGVSLDQERSTELVSWAILNLARPADTVVALHVLAAAEEGVSKPVRRQQTRARKAKAFVISVMGEFANVCRAKQVNLEARVGFSSTVGKGLVEEAKSISTEYLLLGTKSNIPDRNLHGTQKYCLDHTPKPCSLVLIGKSGTINVQEFYGSNAKRLTKSKHANSPKNKRENRSPRNVLDYHSTEEDSSSFEGSSTAASPLAPVLKGHSSFRKQISSLRRISSFILSPFELNSRKRGAKFPVEEKPQPLLKCFSYEELAVATNDFHPDNIVGIGGYSKVYKGELENQQAIAVKKLARDNKDQNKEKEFLMELGILGHVNHPNTASLVGCCVENGLYLIFNYYPNGTLSSALHGENNKRLEWPERYKIALGVARGLHYLHTYCKHRIIHRDIKASNVLLGPDFEPQISDFGLAKWLPSKWTHHAVLPIEGTFGCLAPEYFMHGIVDEKTDIFAFGVLLLEIITGRMPVDSEKQNLVLWAKPMMESGEIDKLVDPDLDDEYDSDQIYRIVLTSSYCVRQSSISRPSMTEVLELLQHGDNSEAAESRRMLNFTQEENEMDDYSMIFGYDVPSDISLDDI